MKKTTGPAQPANHSKTDSNPMTALERIKLAFLDEYVCEKTGYDPYDTSRGRSPDIWASKRKRA